MWISRSRSDDTFMVEGEDARHLLQVLRMRRGRAGFVSARIEGDNYLCQIESADKGQVTLRVLEESGIHRIRKTYLSFSGSAKG